MKILPTALSVMVLATVALADNDQLAPLSQIVEELQDETDPYQVLHPVASRCLANRTWAKIRFSQSFEVTNDISEKQFSDAMGDLAALWLPRLREAASHINPNSSADETWNQIQLQLEFQVRAYTESAERERALTGHYMPETAIEDATICSSLEEGMK